LLLNGNFIPSSKFQIISARVAFVKNAVSLLAYRGKLILKNGVVLIMENGIQVPGKDSTNLDSFWDTSIPRAFERNSELEIKKRLKDFHN
jgi:hypothetical protein